MPVIWGFDLSEMRWNAFGHKQMFDPKWHLRKERFIVYQIAMLTALAAECCATYSLSKYNFQESDIEEASLLLPSSQSTGLAQVVFNNDIYAAQCLTIIFCVLVATIFGTDFFFLLFFPRRRYPNWYHVAKKALAVGVTLGMLAASIMSTIVIATHTSFVEGPDPDDIATLVNRFRHPPMVYRRWDVNIAWLVLLWIAFVATVASTILMFIASKHDKQHGTEPYPRDGTHGDTLTAGPKRSANLNEKHARPSTTTDDDSFGTPARTSVSTRGGSTVDGPHAPANRGGLV